MKYLLIPIFFFLISADTKAQYPKLIVQLKDKAGSTFSLSDPSAYLSQKTIQKRLRLKITVDSLDLPVSKIYLDSIQHTGNLTILSTSKWLNQVLIQTTDAVTINKLRSFAFVRSVAGVGYRSMNDSTDSKFNERTTTPVSTTIRATGTQNNVYDYGNSYAQVHIHEGEFLHNKGYHGENMQITLLDAGFLQYKTLSAFDSLRLNKQILGEKDFVALDNSVNEDDSHGMYCLSILGANLPGKMVGTAPKANYWLIRTENAASEYPVEEHNWVVGAEFADSTGSDMISTSLGYNTFDDAAFNHTYNDLYKNTTMVSQGVAIAARKGMIVTVSAGNEGAGAWKYITFPADADSVCTVGAVNSARVIASFSSYGYPGKTKPNIVSVGAGTVIAGLNNQIASGNGTSFSNPNIAGLIACLWQAFPNVSNMKILEAVYRSADKFSSPDNQYGYGIPNFRTAYLSLKHDENVGAYGSEWLFATPAPFINQLDVKFVGRLDGTAMLTLLNSSGQIIASHNLPTQQEEVYNYSFLNLTNLPAGFYTLKYSDSITTRTLRLQKGNIFERDWLVALPNPFTDDVSVFLKAQETGSITLRLIDTKGNVVDVVNQEITQNETTTIHFPHVQNLPPGVFFLQYLSSNQKRTLRLFKGQ